MLHVHIDNPELEHYFHHSADEVLAFLEKRVGEKSFTVSSIEEVHERIIRSEASEDVGETEYEEEMKHFLKKELHTR